MISGRNGMSEPLSSATLAAIDRRVAELRMLAAFTSALGHAHAVNGARPLSAKDLTAQAFWIRALRRARDRVASRR